MILCHTDKNVINTIANNKIIAIKKYVKLLLLLSNSTKDIIDNIGVSKPTVVHMFQQLIKVGILEKVKNKVYRFRNTKFTGEH